MTWREKILFVGFLGAILSSARAMEAESSYFAGQDLHITSPVMKSYRPDAQGHGHVMLLEEGFTLSIGDNRITADRAAIFLDHKNGSQSDTLGHYYQARVCAEGNVSVDRGGRSRTTVLSSQAVEGADAMAVQFQVTGQVFVTTDQHESISWTALERETLYQQARSIFSQMKPGPALSRSAQVPSAGQVDDIFRAGLPSDQKMKKAQGGPVVSGEEILVPGLEPAGGADGPSGPVITYPVHITALWEPAPEIESKALADGRKIATVRGRFYLWQKLNEQGELLEFLADNAVVYYSMDSFSTGGQAGNELASGPVQAVYFSGNIVMTEAGRTTRADEIFYDFTSDQAVVVNAEMRTFDEQRGLPIYLRAEKLRRVSRNLFQAENIRLTSSEFYFPQISLHASEMVLLTGDQVDLRDPEPSADDPAAQVDGYLEDIRMDLGDWTLFRWPSLRTNFVRPDVPISRIRFGNDSDFGTTVETRWHLDRLLGRKVQPGVENRLALDYFSERGFGAGIESEYEKENSFGTLLGYVMRDRGEDDLGRTSDRKNLDPKQDIRGRFSWRHREYLPYDWQLTAEISYLSDENFQELMYRDEFYTDKAQETLLHLKRITGNQGLSILGKFRINDFETMMEELPTVEFHKTGESIWDHRLTTYHDTQVSRLRNRFDNDADSQRTSQDFYTFATHRSEVDLPLMFKTLKLVPFVAGSYTYEDHDEFDLDLDNRMTAPEDELLLGEFGVRMSTMFWKVDPTVRSRIWDLNGLRHTVVPHMEVVFYEQNDRAVEMRDTINVGVSQRWQTHRGPAENPRTEDWIRWDIDTTWVRDPADWDIPDTMTYGPANFVFNNPAIPMLDRRNDPWFGLVRNSVNSDFEWRLSDTTAVLSDLNYDIDSCDLQQFNVGFNRFVYPELSYYIGSRYLRPVIVEDTDDGIYEQGSHSFITAITYMLSPRYTMTFAQEYNFDYGKTVRSDLTFIRQYHRLFYGLSFSIDQSLDRQAITFSVWPQGVRELAVGSRKYMGLTGAIREE